MKYENTGKNLIAGYWKAGGKVSYRSVNPQTGMPAEPLFYDATSQETDESVKAAASAFSAFRTKSVLARVRLLKKIATLMESQKNGILKVCQRETGLPADRLESEFIRTLDQIRFLAGIISNKQWYPQHITRGNPSLFLDAIPLGPVAVFGAGNFPLAFSVAGGDTISALASGCPVIHKAHPGHPETCYRVAECVHEAIQKSNFPEGIFSLLQGDNPKCGLELVSHPLLKGVGFTGSLAAGLSLKSVINQRKDIIPFYAEMGSLNPVFLLPDSLKQNAAQIAADLYHSVTLGTGQFCTRPGLFFFVENDVAKDFIEILTMKFATGSAGLMLNKKTKDRFHHSLRNILGKNIIKKRAEAKSGNGACYASPVLITVSARMFADDPDLQNEVFGPVTIGVAAKSKIEMLECADLLQGQLTATIHATSSEFPAWKELVSLLEEKCGRLILNGYPTGVMVSEAMQHGGPYPATSNPQFSSVGGNSLLRWVRPITYQGFSFR